VGNESTCEAQIGNRQLTGKALLESSELLFRPTDGSKRLKIPFTSIKSAKAIDGKLHLQTAEGQATFDLGPTAETWCHKILHPKTRTEKLGLKPNTSVSLLGAFDLEFKKELRATAKKVTESRIEPSSELIFLNANTTKELTSAVTKAAKSIKGATALWLVYPKGKKEITELEVIAAGRKFGLKDVKVVAFSPTHTALKFVLPLDKR
jgi:hypothetical protein